MKTARIRIALFCLLAGLYGYAASKSGSYAGTDAPRSTPERASQQTTIPGSGSPVSWLPFKDSFTGTEGEAFLIAIGVDCPSRTPTGNEFELLPPTPSFVHLSHTFLDTVFPSVANIISVIPQPGDAGKYQIKVRATPCYGSAGSELTFKLKVKRAQ